MKANNVTQKPNTPKPRRSPVSGGVRFSGLYSSVARRLNVSRQFVHQVATGKRTSKRISDAIQREKESLLKKLAEEAA